MKTIKRAVLDLLDVGPTHRTAINDHIAHGIATGEIQIPAENNLTLDRLVSLALAQLQAPDDLIGCVIDVEVDKVGPEGKVIAAKATYFLPKDAEQFQLHA